jgi:phospholipase C
MDMPPGLDSLKHIVVLMMENRSFDHMLGGLKAQDSRIDGLTGNESNPDTTGALVKVLPQAEFQSQLDPDPDHHFPAVDLQIFNGDTSDARVPTMQGFVKSYFNQQHNVAHSAKIMYYFPPEKLPILTTLATEFAVFNGWFASIPGPTICNRAFAHYGTSFGQVSMDVFYVKEMYKSIYERMIASPPHTAKIYYFDDASSTMEIVNLLQHQPSLFGTFEQFLSDCDNNSLPEYSFIEPNYNDHPGDSGALIASDQHPDHNVQEGERLIAQVYNKIHDNAELWKTTALLVVYDEHGGIYDHVPPPKCDPKAPDGGVASPNDTGTGKEFRFDRLGVRVPAILISPWVPKATVVKGPQEGGRTFEHASIPATVTKFFLGSYDQRSAREKAADTFLDLLSLPVMRDDAPIFEEA